MAKGRPRNPDRAKTKTGNRPLPEETPPAPVDALALLVPSPPRDLDESLHTGWHLICEDLAGRGRTPAALREVDLEMVRQLLEAVWVHQQATEILHIEGVMIYKREPILVDGEPTGEFATLDAKQHPAVKIQREASATYLRLADALAINPLARVRAGLMQVAGASLAMTLAKEMRKALGGPE